MPCTKREFDAPGPQRGQTQRGGPTKDPGLVILGVVAVGFLFVVLPVALTAFGRYREPRAIVCPEADRPAKVTVDARHATATTASRIGISTP